MTNGMRKLRRTMPRLHLDLLGFSRKDFLSALRLTRDHILAKYFGLL